MDKLVERLLVCTFDDFRQSNLLYSVFSLDFLERVQVSHVHATWKVRDDKEIS